MIETVWQNHLDINSWTFFPSHQNAVADDVHSIRPTGQRVPRGADAPEVQLDRQLNEAVSIDHIVVALPGEMQENCEVLGAWLCGWIRALSRPASRKGLISCCSVVRQDLHNNFHSGPWVTTPYSYGTLRLWKYGPPLAVISFLTHKSQNFKANLWKIAPNLANACQESFVSWRHNEPSNLFSSFSLRSNMG